MPERTGILAPDRTLVPHIARVELDVKALNQSFENEEPPAITRWAAETFGSDLVMSSSFGDQSVVLLHMASRIRPDIKVIFIDTGYLFPETHQFMELVRRRLNLNIWSYRTRADPIAYLHQASEATPSWRKDVNACCALNKNEPFERAMRDLAPRAWLRGARRDQAETRKKFRFVEWFSRYGCWAVSPLLRWTAADIAAYMKQHDLPHHPLVARGYMSIGCNPLSCTRPIAPGEDPRAGRWAGQAKTECGINLDSLDSAGL